jgi:hypothetical protein
MAWKDIVAGTGGRNAPAKYNPRVDIEKLERLVWKEGTPVTTDKPFKVMEFLEEIGASEGKSSWWVRVEITSGNVIHGHPLTAAEFRKYTKW